MKRYTLYFTLLFLSLMMSACSSIDFNNPKKAACNQLKSDLVFNGATSDTRRAEIENAQTPLETRNYDEANCGP